MPLILFLYFLLLFCFCFCFFCLFWFWFSVFFFTQGGDPPWLIYVVLNIWSVGVAQMCDVIDHIPNMANDLLPYFDTYVTQSPTWVQRSGVRNIGDLGTQSKNEGPEWGFMLKLLTWLRSKSNLVNFVINNSEYKIMIIEQLARRDAQTQSLIFFVLHSH